MSKCYHRGVGKRIAALGSVVVLACAYDGGQTVLDLETIADVSGESDAPCVLTLASGKASLTYDVAATALAPGDASTTRATLGACIENGPDVTVAVTPRGGAPALAVERGASCMTIRPGATDSTRALFDDLGVTVGDCPTTIALTLSCGGSVLYDAAPLDVCIVAM